jgi:hypothetical protein
VIDGASPNRIYAATMEGGFWRSDDEGDNWRPINKNIVYLEAWSLAQDAQGLLYAGTGPASVYRSEDGGENWEDLRSLKTMHEMIDWTFPMPPYVPHVKHLSISPNDPKIILGAVEEGWIIQSRDAGKTWRNLKNGTEFDAHTVVAFPDSERIVMTSGQGAMLSEDGGESFSVCNEGINRRYLAHVCYHPERPDRLFTAGAEGYPGLWRKRPEGALSEFYRSENGGRSWERLTNGVPDAIHAAARATAMAPDDADTVFVGLGDGAVWASSNGGESFAQVVEGASAIYHIAATPQ